MTFGPWLGLAATSFIAAVLQATNGFGFAVLAVPFFLLLAPPDVAIPTIVVMSLSVSVFTLPRLYRYAHLGLLRRLTLGCLAALPFGLVAASHANAAIVKAVAGAVVTGFAVVLAWYRSRRSVGGIVLRPGRDVAVGAVAGLATGLVGMAGPPPLIYLMLGGGPMRTVRATLIAFFVIVYTVALTVNVVCGSMPRAAWLVAASLLPFVWAGGRIGLRVGERLGEATAAGLAIGVLAVGGLYTLAAAALAALW